MKRELSEKNHRKEIRNSGNDDEAAIAMALYLYFNEMHDEESDIITVKRSLKNIFTVELKALQYEKSKITK